jgi:hypothetical protein
MLREYLETEIANWEFIGAPALLQRFVLRNGRSYTPTFRTVKLGEPKQCFDNAARAVLHKSKKREGWSYVEGFALNRAMPIMAFHHAWVTTDGIHAMDVTLPDASAYDFIGIPFNRQTVQACRGCVLDTGFGLNWKLMFELDPELKGIVEAIKPHRNWTQAQKEMTT